MVKGCQRQMVVLKCASDSAFENAYFILRNDKQRSFTEEEIITQANRIISENCFSRRKKKSVSKVIAVIAAFFCGALISALITVFVFGVSY